MKTSNRIHVNFARNDFYYIVLKKHYKKKKMDEINLSLRDNLTQLKTKTKKSNELDIEKNW